MASMHRQLISDLDIACTRSMDPVARSALTDASLQVPRQPRYRRNSLTLSPDCAISWPVQPLELVHAYHPLARPIPCLTFERQPLRRPRHRRRQVPLVPQQRPPRPVRADLLPAARRGPGGVPGARGDLARRLAAARLRRAECRPDRGPGAVARDPRRPAGGRRAGRPVRGRRASRTRRSGRRPRPPA